MTKNERAGKLPRLVGEFADNFYATKNFDNRFEPLIDD